jgi:hypothetical protein
MYCLDAGRYSIFSRKSSTPYLGIFLEVSIQPLQINAFSLQAFELQQQNWDSAMKTVSKFLSFMEILRDFGGSFTIRDYDDSSHGKDVSGIFPGVALYGYKGCVLKATAQDAEEYALNIRPIKWHESTGTSPWRRLMQVEPYI